MNPKVDDYIEQSDKWPDEITELRPILLGCGLTEELKWRKPCYSHNGENVVLIQEMNNFLALMFFKGALLEDPLEVLRDQGPNSRWARRLQFSSVDEVTCMAETVKGYVEEAIDVADAGLAVGPAPEPVLVEELQARLDDHPALNEAFNSLTPGRRREYNLFFSGAKQAKTRAGRVEKYVQRILDGKGMRER